MKSCHFYLFTQSFQGIATSPLSLSSGPMCLLLEALHCIGPGSPFQPVPHWGYLPKTQRGYVASLINNVQQDQFQARSAPAPCALSTCPVTTEAAGSYAASALPPSPLCQPLPLLCGPPRPSSFSGTPSDTCGSVRAPPMQLD